MLALIDAWAATIDAAECRPLARTLHRWEDEILAFHTAEGGHQRPNPLDPMERRAG